MNIKSEFIKPENVYLIWELLSEQNIIKNQPNQVKEQISNYVVNEIHRFYNNISKNQISKNGLTLIYLNKEYIKFIIYYVKTNYPNQINKIKIHEEPITFKDIQEQRELEFNTRFNEMQNDFTNMVTLKKPEMPQFEDNIGVEDKPVSVNDMEERIKEMTLKRNYDLQIVNKNNDIETGKKNVSFHNEDIIMDDKESETNKDKDNIAIKNSIDFFTKLDTIDTFDTFDTFDTLDNTDVFKTTENTNLQEQINILNNKMSSLETKLEQILEKLNTI